MVRTKVVRQDWSQNHCHRDTCTSKGLGILENVVETLLRMQMFPNLDRRETCVAETNFAAQKTKKGFCLESKTFCFPDTNFASETMFPSLATPRET